MRKGWTIGHFRDVPIVIHISMLVVIPLLTIGMTYENFPGLLTQLGIAGDMLALPPVVFGFALSVGLFGSVLLHEMGHALVALATGGRVRKITLMALGGMTEIDQDDATPGQTMAVAFAGPLANLILGFICLAAARGVGLVSTDGQLFLMMLGGINLILAAFNLLPTFPLDGGRILKGLLAWKLTEKRAADVTSTVGRTFAMFLGLLGLARGDVFLMFVATFLYFGAATDARAVGNREALDGLTARQAMTTRVVNVSPHRPITSVARHMLMQDATAALVSTRTDTLGVILPADLRQSESDEVGDLIDGPALYVDLDEPLPDIVREMRWSRRPAIVRDRYNAIVGVVTLAEVERAITLRKIADRGLVSPDASIESQEHGA
ncbi:MAG: site-2 protease family protein [Myxococcota bacterium]|nr:site-2 protease family protein [Myxococcota bacterium]